MGKRIRVQRRGRGTTTFRANTHLRVSAAKYLPWLWRDSNLLNASVEDFIHDPGRGSPLVKLRLKNNQILYTIAPEGMAVGQVIEIGPSAVVEVGNIMQLGNISPGTLVCNLELMPGDGGKIARSSGTYATIVTKTPEVTIVKLPSGRSINLNNLCMATVGVVSGSGRTEKPFVKAGKRLSLMKSKGRVYPITKGIAMNPAFHPHGGGSHTSSSLRPTTIGRNAPPGKKVGNIASRRTGKRKRN